MVIGCQAGGQFSRYLQAGSPVFNFPRSCKINAAGQYQETIKQSYVRYWDESAEVADWFYGEGQCNDKAHALALAATALGLNYRFTLAEQNAFGLIDVESLMVVLAWSVDVPGAQELESKKN